MEEGKSLCACVVMAWRELKLARGDWLRGNYLGYALEFGAGENSTQVERVIRIEGTIAC